MKTVKLNINGRDVTAPEGTNLLEAARMNGIAVEHFCYHRYLAVDGNCRTCMAEIEGPRGPSLAISCNTKVAEGMKARFDSPQAVRAQKAALEFLLLDHPLDCPVCDKAGECSLQDHYQEFGRYDPDHPMPRYFKGGKALDIGEHIVLDQERCVLCTRCIRFLDSVPRTSELCITNRGHEARLGVFPGRRLDNPYSGNVTDVCPVGALTLKEFRFKQRVWFLKRTESICNGCSRGCNITVEHNRGRIWRFMPRENPFVNLAWMCDEGRLSFDRLQKDRLTSPVVTAGSGTTLGAAFQVLAEFLRKTEPGRVAALVSPGASNEDLVVLKRLFTSRWPVKNLAALIPPEEEGDDVLRTPQKHPNEQGIRLLGIPTDDEALLKRMENGEFSAVLVLEGDPLTLGGEKAKRAFDEVEFLAVLSPTDNAMIEEASLAFPVAAFFEKDGTFVNAQGRLQRFRKAFEPAGEGALPASTLLSRLEGFLEGKDVPGSEPRQVFDAWAASVPSLRKTTFDSIPACGIPLDLKPLSAPPFAGVKVPVPNVVARPGGGREGTA